MTCDTQCRPAVSDPARDPVHWHLALRPPELIGTDGMTAGEQMFFLGAPLAHVLAYELQLKGRRSRDTRGAARLSRIAIHRG